MKAFYRIKTITSFCILYLASHGAIAATPSVAALACPSADDIRQFNYVFGFPYGFDVATGQLKVIAVAEQNGDLIRDFEDEWGLFINPVLVKPSEDARITVNHIVQQLEPIASTPFHFNIIEDLNMQFCVYTLPGNNTISALAFFNDNDLELDNNDDNDEINDIVKKHSKAKTHHQKRLMQIAKQLLLK